MMPMLLKDIVLDDTAFSTASDDMAVLKERTETLKTMLEEMYKDLTDALKTPAGEQVQLTAKNVLIDPVNDLLIVINHVSSTLDEIIGTGYYKDVFVEFERLNQNINFNN